jgi:hypothetical protein
VRALSTLQTGYCPRSSWIRSGCPRNATTNIQIKVKAQAAREIPVEKQPKPKYKSLTIWAGILSIVTGTADFITNFTVEDAVQVHR